MSLQEIRAYNTETKETEIPEEGQTKTLSQRTRKATKNKVKLNKKSVLAAESRVKTLQNRNALAEHLNTEQYSNKQFKKSTLKAFKIKQQELTLKAEQTANQSAPATDPTTTPAERPSSTTSS